VAVRIGVSVTTGVGVAVTVGVAVAVCAGVAVAAGGDALAVGVAPVDAALALESPPPPHPATARLLTTITMNADARTHDTGDPFSLPVLHDPDR
jgi:hypothetical protein